MILLDFSGAMYADIHVNLKQNCGITTDIQYLRHLIINSLRTYNKKFSSTYGELVLCLDSREVWRREVFPYYKACRKKARLESGIDWDSVFKDVNTIVEEIQEFLPYKTIKIEGLEADDVIAILAKNAEAICEKNILGEMKHNVLIVSNDKDYAQLHKLSYVKQYKPRTGNIVKDKDPSFALTDLILHGDKADGIPNIKSEEDTFVTDGKRQKSIKSEFVRQFLNEGTNCLSEFELNRYNMNKRLISFDEIPVKYNQEVVDEFNKSKNFSKFRLLEYFARNKLNQLIDKIGDF